LLFHLTDPHYLLGDLIAVVLGFVLHNVAQAGLARALGDRLPRNFLTWRLPQHLDPFGAVAVVLVGIGWPKPVPVNDRWRARRWRNVAVLAAGPVTYLLLALAFLGLTRLFYTSGYSFLTTTFSDAALLSCGLFVTSLLPVPPLDLGRAIFLTAPPTPGWQRARYNLEAGNWGVGIALAILLVHLVLRVNPVLQGPYENLYTALLPVVGLTAA
jgi:Zn-dependent protease